MSFFEICLAQCDCSTCALCIVEVVYSVRRCELLGERVLYKYMLLLLLYALFCEVGVCSLIVKKRRERKVSAITAAASTVKVVDTLYFTSAIVLILSLT